MEQRADGGESHEIRWSFTTDSFQCDAKAYNTFNTPRQVRNALPPMNVEREDTEFVTRMLETQAEYRYAALIAAQTEDLDLGAGGANRPWSGATSTELADIEAGRIAIVKATGFEPNLMAIGRDVLTNIRTNTTSGSAGASIRATLALGADQTMRKVSPAYLQEYFDVPEVIIGGQVYNTEDENIAFDVADQSFIWPDTVILAYVERRPRMKANTLGWTFEAQKMRTFTWRQASRGNARIVEVEEIVDRKIVNRLAAYIITNVI
jgi:hypothetical protein